MSISAINTHYVNKQLPYKVTNTQTQPITNGNINNNSYITSDASMAFRAYGLAEVNNNSNLTSDYFNLSFDDYIAKLNREGKKEGVDYTVNYFNNEPTFIEIKNQNGLVTDYIEYENGKCSRADINIYKNNKLFSTTSRTTDRVELQLKYYYNNDQKPFSDKYHLDFNTTPKDFAKYLEKNNIKYDIKYSGDEDNNRSIYLKEYDKDGNEVRNYWWYYGENSFDEQCSSLSVSDLNKNAEEVRRTSFENDRVEVCDYFYRCKSEDYDNNASDVSKLSKYGITFNTTIQEYIEKLQKNNIKYEIKEIFNGLGTEVIEYDELGNTKSETSWIYDKNGELERICLWEINDNGRKRFDFYKDTTETKNLRYI